STASHFPSTSGISSRATSIAGTIRRRRTLPDRGITIARDLTRARCHQHKRKAPQDAALFDSAFSVMPEQRQQQDHRQRDSEQPEQSASSKTHGSLLLLIAQMTQEVRRSSAMDQS